MGRQSCLEKMEGLAGKNILLTGGLGFIGGHLTQSLVKKNCTVVIPYLYKDEQARYNLGTLKKQATIVKCNILNLKDISKILLGNKINYIIHLAAESQVTSAHRKPLQTLKTNILGTAVVLESARLYANIEGIIVASSDKAYGKSKMAYKENDRLSGDHPYDVSKSSADLIAQTYHKTYQLPVIVTRFGNVYGEADLHFDRLIPGISKSIVKKKVFEIRSNGKYLRDYVHVFDVVEGYMHLVNNFKKLQGHAFNFSSGDNLSVVEVIKKIEKTLDLKVPYKILDTAVNEIPQQHLDDKKVRKSGWKPKRNMDKTISSIVSWYYSYFNTYRLGI